MSSKKNAKEKAPARKEAEKKAKNKRTMVNGIAVGMLFVGLWAGLTIPPAFASNTCGSSETAMEALLEKQQGEDVELLQVTQRGREKEVVYTVGAEQSTAVFQRRLLGLRWAYGGEVLP
ncbi:hypothetical protein [Oscillibacter sp.]|uniref:hypothetical protein n=1 Tax=Oscillibacter sp. TaxID=1945593 RepID=UPI0026091455|nr:hypothetical protein [Oscillibacter sp.]MDD3346435.1 hypothetical protein [Oscillibacter sp.]